MAKLTIAILQHNLFNLTKQALDSLRGAYRPDYEVIVVDNGSNAENQALLRAHQSPFPIKKIFLDHNKGTAGGWNAAFEAASSPFIYCLHNDAIVRDPEMFEKLYGDFQQYDHVGAVAACTDEVFTRMQRCARPELLPNDVISVSKMDNVSCMFSKACWQECGKFDENYLYGNYEDTDFYMKARSLNWQLIIDRRVWIEHLCSQTFSAYRFSSALERNRQLFLSKWGEYPEEKIYKTLSPS